MSSRLLVVLCCSWLCACAAASLPDAEEGAEDSFASRVDGSAAHDGGAPGLDAAATADAAAEAADAGEDGGVAAQADGGVVVAADAEAADVSTVDASSPDAGARALYVDPQSGLDANDGLRATPLKTIAYAASLARAGEEIVLLPGLYSSATEPTFGRGSGRVRIPDGVTVRAEQPGTVEVTTGSSEGIGFVGTGRLADVRFSGSPRAITSTSGAIALAGLRFADAMDSCGGGGNTAPIALGGTATATLTVGSSTTGEVLGASMECLVRLQGDAHLTIRGVRFTRGAASSYAGSAMLAPRDRSHLHLDRVTVEGPRGPVLHAVDDTRIVITDSAFHDSAAALLLVGERSWLDLERSSIDGVGGEAVAMRGEAGVNDQHLTVRDSTIQNVGRAIATTLASGSPLPTVRVERTVIHDCLQGISLGAGTLSVHSSTISRIAGYGIAVNNMRSVRLRGTRITQCMNWAIEATGFAAGTTFDLGTAADPGGNDLRGNNVNAASTSCLRYYCVAGAPGTAVGNTWELGAQGADAAGHYGVPGGQAALDVTGPQSGRNYQLNAACSLRLAE